MSTVRHVARLALRCAALRSSALSSVRSGGHPSHFCARSDVIVGSGTSWLQCDSSVSDWCISNSQDEKLNDKTLCSGYQALFSHRKGSVNVELSHSSMQYAHWMVFSAEHSRPAICDGQVVYCCCDLCRRLLHVASYRCILHVAILHVVRPQWTTHSRRRCLSL